MRSLSYLNLDDASLFDEITLAKRQPRRGRLQGLRAAVVQAYEEYLAIAPQLGAITAMELTEPQKDALLHAYAVETVPMLKLRQKLLQRVDAARCPFCGLSESSTLDHYLPKEQQPEFSVFSRNLVPCCSPCNGRKLDRVVDEGNAVRLFLHPYFDSIPATRFVQVRVVLGENALGITYAIRRTKNMAPAVFEHLRSHFRLLGLANRYRLMALDRLRGEYQSFVRAYGPDADWQRLATMLRDRAVDLAAGHGINNWVVVLYRELSRSRAFCDGGFKLLKVIQ